VDLELRDVVAIHRLPSDRPGEKTIIVRLFNSDAKRNVMRAKKNLKNNIRFVDDITKQNHELMKRMRVPSLSDFNVNVIIQTKFELFIIRCSSIYATIVEPHSQIYWNHASYSLVQYLPVMICILNTQ
jgi:hypothetical protein